MTYNISTDPSKDEVALTLATSCQVHSVLKSMHATHGEPSAESLSPANERLMTTNSIAQNASHSELRFHSQLGCGNVFGEQLTLLPSTHVACSLDARSFAELLHDEVDVGIQSE
jgi:hypothetical protein